MSEPVSAPTTPDEMIRLEQITKRFGGVTALRDVSFSIARGEIHALDVPQDRILRLRRGEQDWL